MRGGGGGRLRCRAVDPARPRHGLQNGPRELRARSDSLLAPMCVHWAVNGVGQIFVQVA